MHYVRRHRILRASTHYKAGSPRLTRMLDACLLSVFAGLGLLATYYVAPHAIHLWLGGVPSLHHTVAVCVLVRALAQLLPDCVGAAAEACGMRAGR